MISLLGVVTWPARTGQGREGQWWAARPASAGGQRVPGRATCLTSAKVVLAAGDALAAQDLLAAGAGEVLLAGERPGAGVERVAHGGAIAALSRHGRPAHHLAVVHQVHVDHVQSRGGVVREPRSCRDAGAGECGGCEAVHGRWETRGHPAAGLRRLVRRSANHRCHWRLLPGFSGQKVGAKACRGAGGCVARASVTPAPPGAAAERRGSA